jgi:diguanylate cyclase (GGDEF)-like protein/PAS domain S-box-containing protein
MQDEEKTREQLTSELMELRQRVAELETSEAEQEQRAEALRKGEAHYRAMVEAQVDAVCRWLPDTTLTFVNEGYCTFFGRTREELIGQLWLSLVPEHSRQSVREFCESLAATPKAYVYEHEMIGADGRICWQEWSAYPVRDDQARVVEFQSVGRDITERKRREETLRHLAYHDHLTGLPNRMLFNQRLILELSHARRNQQRLAIMLLDLDRFKDINDALGHDVGDKLLQAVGERLTDLLRRSDTICRMGGDEFTLILPEIIRARSAATVAEKILDAVRKPFMCEGHEIYVTTSIGIAIYPDDGADGDILIRKADIALYRAKDNGRDNHQHYSSTSDSVVRTGEHLDLGVP